jgi:hypothetical protein
MKGLLLLVCVMTTALVYSTNRFISVDTSDYVAFLKEFFIWVCSIWLIHLLGKTAYVVWMKEKDNEKKGQNR